MFMNLYYPLHPIYGIQKGIYREGYICFCIPQNSGHGGAMVTHSQVSSANPEPYVGKLVVAY